MIYKYPKTLSEINFISNKINFINHDDYNKVVSNQNIKKDEILLIESSKFNLFGFDSENRELKILKIYIINKDHPDIKNLYPRNNNFIKTDMIYSIHKIIKSVKYTNKDIYNFLTEYPKEEIEFYFAKYIYNAFEGNEFGPLTLPNIAKLNHSCKPNVKFVFNKNDGNMYVQSIRNIKKGEEIFDSYLEKDRKSTRLNSQSH